MEAIADRLGISRDKMFVNLDRYGNTSAAAVAIALDEANRTGRIKRGDYVLMVVFGGGLTWASTVIDEFSQMRRAIYPGSFDPVTNGHLDVIERARKLFDEVVVAVAHNDEKQPLFSLEQRLDLLRKTAGQIENVRIAEFSGLLVEFARAQNAGAVIRGLRAVSDFEFEFQMALMNRNLNAAVETIFLMPKEEYTYLSSRIVKEIARLGGNVSTFVPGCVVKALSGKFSQ